MLEHSDIWQISWIWQVKPISPLSYPCYLIHYCTYVNLIRSSFHPQLFFFHSLPWTVIDLVSHSGASECLIAVSTWEISTSHLVTPLLHVLPLLFGQPKSRNPLLLLHGLGLTCTYRSKFTPPVLHPITYVFSSLEAVSPYLRDYGFELIWSCKEGGHKV